MHALVFPIQQSIYSGVYNIATHHVIVIVIAGKHRSAYQLMHVVFPRYVQTLSFTYSLSLSLILTIPTSLFLMTSSTLMGV